MFPSNNNSIINNDLLLLPNNDQSKPFTPSSINEIPTNTYNIVSPNPKQPEPDPYLPFFHFSSPYVELELEPENLITFIQQSHDHGNFPDDHGNFPDDHGHHHQQSFSLNILEDCTIGASETITYMEDFRKICGAEPTPRKRSSKGDRHSKINTAKGLRDRRMRLSFEVAREFFGLQEMLGHDKASKTVEWLLTQAKSEIEKLARSVPQAHHSFCSAGSNSASSVNFTTDHFEVVSEKIDNDKGSNTNESKEKSAKEKTIKKPRKSNFRTIPKDLRAKARERAKGRTEEKKRRREFGESKLCGYEELMRNSDMNQLGYNWSSFETGEESGTQSHNNKNSLSFQEVEEPSPNNQATPCKLGMNEEEIMDESLILNYHQNNGSTSLEHQYTDLQFLGKPWEVYNNQILCLNGWISMASS